MELKTLSNGLRAVLVPCEAESVAFGLFVASGSRHEPERLRGISHFIEHMLFKGTPKRGPLQISQAIEGRGGMFNACTGEEATVYFTHMPYEYLEESVDILADMFLNALIPESEFDREKQVILEEIKMYADEPDSVAQENLQRALFPKSSLGAPVAGSVKSLGPMTPQDLRDYVASHYVPSRTVAVLVGRFDPAAATDILEAKLAALPRSRGRFGTTGDPFAGTCVPEVVAKREVQQQQLALGYRTFGRRDPRKYAASVFDAILGRGMSSRLFQELREKRGLSYDIASRMSFFSDAGMWTVTAGLDPKKAAKALETIDRELNRIRTKRVPASELRRVKEFLTGNFRLGHEKVISKMFFYGQTLLAFGRPVDPSEQVAGIRSVTADDVLSVANEILRPENRTVSTVVPK